jgi:hypothetical protein
MARKKSLKLWQIRHVEFARSGSRRTDGDYTGGMRGSDVAITHGSAAAMTIRTEIM